MTISAQAGARPINTAIGGGKLLVANTATDAEHPAVGEPVSLQALDLPDANAITRAAGGMPEAARRVEKSLVCGSAMSVPDLPKFSRTIL